MKVIERGEGVSGEIALRYEEAPDGSPQYELILNGTFLMASSNRLSERALAQEALAPLRETPRQPNLSRSDPAALAQEAQAALEETPEGEAEGLCLLVGGLGLGFTLQAVLEDRRVSRVDVVEIEPFVVQWNGEYFSSLNGHALADPRVHLVQADLQEHLRRCPPRLYHAACLDIDNGPSWTVNEDNASLYEEKGLRSLQRTLRENGVLTLWAAEESPPFARLLQSLFARVDVLFVDEKDPRGDLTSYPIYRAFL